MRCIGSKNMNKIGFNNQKYLEMQSKHIICLLYTSDAADDTPCVDLGGRRIIKKKIF